MDFEFWIKWMIGNNKTITELQMSTHRKTNQPNAYHHPYYINVNIQDTLLWK